MRVTFMGLLLMSATRCLAAPSFEAAWSNTAASSCHLDGPSGQAANERSFATSLSLVEKLPGPAQNWFWDLGVQAENFSFAHAGPLPNRLQDEAVVVGCEYDQGGEAVASVTLTPGFYFGGQVNSSAWDVPVEAISGFPLTAQWSGVVGFNNARFYHHALPVAGLVWTPGAALRIEAVFPEPALVWWPRRETRLRVGGELTGVGFSIQTASDRRTVEYVSYRVGAELQQTLSRGLKLVVGAGIETDRDLDFFHEHQRFHGSGAGYGKIGLTLTH